MKGKIAQWKDDKGFGFIVSENGDERIFFHISAVKTRDRRPQVNDVVLYESMRDSKGRLKAEAVVIESVASASQVHRLKRIHTEPPKKDALDYISIVLLLGSLVGAVIAFIQIDSIEATIPFCVVLVIAVILLNRQKSQRKRISPVLAARRYHHTISVRLELGTTVFSNCIAACATKSG